jgi:hypothetical protein
VKLVLSKKYGLSQGDGFSHQHQPGDQAMDGSIRLSAHERKVLLQEVRRGTDPERRRRAHLLVLLDDGWEWNVIVSVLFTSTSTVNRWRHRYLAGGLLAVVGRLDDSVGHVAIASGVWVLSQSLDL